MAQQFVLKYYNLFSFIILFFSYICYLKINSLSIIKILTHRNSCNNVFNPVKSYIFSITISDFINPMPNKDFLSIISIIFFFNH